MLSLQGSQELISLVCSISFCCYSPKLSLHDPGSFSHHSEICAAVVYIIFLHQLTGHVFSVYTLSVGSALKFEIWKIPLLFHLLKVIFPLNCHYMLLIVPTVQLLSVILSGFVCFDSVLHKRN